jgi:regulator of protease activity HflC (stomatin/prohibitin superfamily)
MEKDLTAANREIKNLRAELEKQQRWNGTRGRFIRITTITLLSLVVGGGIIVGAMVGLPLYRVWAAEYNGRAVLVQAEQTRQVLITQAVAEREAAVARSEAIQIVGQAAKDFPEYRYQEFLGAFAEALKDGKMNQIIYVPTEANIPLMEAGRR